ncbi:hypothetical protein GGR56DRAFT_33720 [Xylariaceae sp. FL0804]|nr:hypothetical protein GGR56DRAFT_33720 [Xylariaceae sp. FL0804]
MPSFERDATVERPVRHSHSQSVSSSAIIPMWDSSDPERAPPPLPLNPQSPSIGSSRSGTSLAIQSAHAALNERARENALVPNLTKRMTDTSPERALVQRPSSHRRMQSLQPGSVRDLSLMLEGPRDSAGSTPRGSPEKERFTRPSTPSRARENERDSKPMEEENDTPGTPTPASSSLTPVMRPTVRRHTQSILGENTPPQSATMLALQNISMPSSSPRETTPLANVTNDSTGASKTLVPHDNLYNQMITLTNIATALQKEMSQLSRRSRDNATDLMSLKEATHARDEDIRKSLRELASNVDTTHLHRDSYTGGLYLDNKPWNSSPTKNSKTFALPRIPSPNSFAASIDRESSLSTPSLIGGDSPASMALLEKIIREMGTRDGQESVVTRLTELAERLAGLASAAKVEDLITHVKTMSQELAVIPAAAAGEVRTRNLSFDEGDDNNSRELDWSLRNGGLTHRVERLLQDKEGRRSSAPPSRGNEVLNDDMMKVIRSVKDSVAQGGGLTAEVKALVRELRGEVLGMGREIGRKLEESHAPGKGHNKTESTSREELVRIVEEGLEQMKVYMHQRLREHRRSSTDSAKSAIDYQEIYNAMRTALSDSQPEKKQTPELSREDVMKAVKVAFDNYKPEIQIEQLGLERDEVLDCLKEGLQDYAPRQDTPQGASRDEVFRAVVEGLKHYEPPRIDTPASLSREEILEAVRECLEEFEFPIAPSAMGNDLSREDMVDAVKQGLDSFEFPNNSAALVPLSGDNAGIIERLHEIMQFMKTEFQAVSEEAKQNVAANGRDTEQVLDATKDGLETLRSYLEECVEKFSGGASPSVSGQEEVMANLANSFDNFREELSELVAKASDDSRDMLKQEVESLRDAMNSSLVPHTPPATDNREALEAIREGLERVRNELLRPHAGTTDILDALHEGFGDVHASIDRMSNQPVDLTANDEILEALKSGLESVRGDIDALRESSQNDKAVANVHDVPSDAIISANLVKQDDIKNLEVMMTQMRIKMEAMETAQPTPVPEGGLSRDDLTEMEEMLRKGVSKDDLLNMEDILRGMQESMAEMSGKESSKEGESPAVNPDDAATKEDVIAIETILRNTKARLDDLVDGEQAVRKDHVDTVEALVLEAKDSLVSITGQLDTITRKEDLVAIESLVTQVTVALDEMKERAEKSLEDPERVTKTDVDAIEAAVLDVKSVVEQMVKSEIAALPSKDDIKGVEDAVKDIKEFNTAQHEASSKALAVRQAEDADVGARITEVKTFLEEFQTMAREKLESGENGVESLGKLLENLSDTVKDSVATDLKEMLETMKSEFEESKAAVAGAKLDTDDKLNETTETLASKIDEKIGELVSKYDEFELVMEDRTKAGEARDVELEAATLGTKAVAEELKVLVDTLGSTVTDSLEKMEEASKTVFEKVEMLYGKAEEDHSDGKNEHQNTRDQIKQAISAVEGLQGHVCEYQPQILEAVKDVLLIVGQHYEHSKSSTTEIQQQIEDAKPPVKDEPPLLPPVEKYDDTEVHSKLDRLDSEVHSKLDKLVDHSSTAEKAYAQLETLDQVHAQVKQTAADISEFLSVQKQRIEDEHEDREQELQETTIALERQRAEKEHVEANLSYLREEEAQMRESILALKTEQEALTRQKLRLTADVSSLETALHIRREELHMMDTRAQGLERRILEGVLDHSRAMLLTKSGAKGREAMSRKRVPGARSSLTSTTAAAEAANSQSNAVKASVSPKPKPRSAVHMAVQGGRAGLLAPPSNPAGVPGRRILSLSQITNNVPAGGLKRSQSVRTGAGLGGLRKGSWAPGRLGATCGAGAGAAAIKKGYGDLLDDKENADLVRESDEEQEERSSGGHREDAMMPEAEAEAEAEPREDEDDEEDDAPTPTALTHDGDDEGSEAGTLRRSSLGTTVITTTTESEAGTEEGGGGYHSDDDDDDDASSSLYYAPSEWTDSAVGASSLGHATSSTADDDRSSIRSESIADTDSIAGEGEVVVYAGAV